MTTKSKMFLRRGFGFERLSIREYGIVGRFSTKDEHKRCAALRVLFVEWIHYHPSRQKGRNQRENMLIASSRQKTARKALSAASSESLTGSPSCGCTCDP
jgi:hypothetical protein